MKALSILLLSLLVSVAQATTITPTVTGVVTSTTVHLRLDDVPANQKLYVAIYDGRQIIWRTPGSWNYGAYSVLPTFTALQAGTNEVDVIVRENVQPFQADLYVGVGANDDDLLARQQVWKIGRLGSYYTAQTTAATVSTTPQVQYDTCDQQGLRSPKGFGPGRAIERRPLGWTSSIPVVGDAAWTCQVQNALYLLSVRAPDKYLFAQRYLRGIDETTVSGIVPSQAVFGMGDTTLTFGTLWFAASSIAHDSYHVYQYQTWLSQHPGQPVPANAYSGDTREGEAINYELQTLIEMGAPQTLVDQLKAVPLNFWNIDGTGSLATNTALRTW